MEVVAGIDAGTHVAVEGAGFLTDGDLVSIVEHAQGMEMPKKAIGG